MNVIILSGRLTDVPQINTHGSTVRATFTLAVDRQVARDANGDRPTDFFRFVTFAKTAEALGDYAVKGQVLEVQGHLTTSSFERDGERRWSTDLVADRVQFGAKPRTKPDTTEPVDAGEDRYEASEYVSSNGA